LRGLGRLDEAEALHREALDLRRKANDGSLEVAESLNNYAGIDLDRGDLGAAAQKLEESLGIRRRILGPEDPLTLQSMSNLAQTYWRLDRHGEAYALLDEVEAGGRALHVDGEEALSQVLANRAAMLIAEQKYQQAAPLLDEALALQLRRVGPKHPLIATTLFRQAQVQAALKHVDEARELWRRSLAIRREPGASPRYLGQALYDYGNFLRAAKDPDGAMDALREAIEVMRSSGSERVPTLARAELVYGELLLAKGDKDAARQHLTEAITLYRAIPDSADELARAQDKLKASTEASPK
jgi:tetratricopeptide (TPR) repeat protein